MLEIIAYGLIWCFAVYGILVMLQEIMHKNTYKKIANNMEFFMIVKNAEDGIENYIRDICVNGSVLNSLTIIDLESEDDTMCILKKLEKENENLCVLNKIDGEKYLLTQVDNI
jgi:hypothetical protein